MNKSQLVQHIAEGADISKASAERALVAFMSTVKNALAAGDEVRLSEFGVFTVGVRAARIGRNPQNGEPVSQPEKRVVKFKALKGLKDSVQ